MMKDSRVTASIALALSVLALFVALKKNKSSAEVSPVRTFEAKAEISGVLCQEGTFLVGFTELREPICREVKISNTAADVSVDRELKKFVGGWVVDGLCKINSSAAVTSEPCRVQNIEGVRECVGDVLPSVISISSTKKIVVPVPCLLHLERCFVPSGADSDTQRIFLSCSPYSVLTMGK